MPSRERGSIPASCHGTVTGLLRYAIMLSCLHPMLCFLPALPARSPSRYTGYVPLGAAGGELGGVNTLGSAMSWEEGLDLLQDHPDPSVPLYNQVIYACAKADQWAPSCWLIEEMHELGLQPDARTYTYALESCGKEGRFEEASHLLNCMKDAGHDVGDDVYRSVLRACAAAAQWRQMMWTFDEMQIRGLMPDLPLYNSAIRGCGVEGEWRWHSPCSEASTRGLSPDRESYEYAIGALVASSKAEEAAKLVQNMTDEGHQPAQELYMSVVQLCQEEGIDIAALRRGRGGGSRLL